MVGLYMLAIWKKAVTDWWQLFSWNKAADEVSCWGWLDFLSKASRFRRLLQVWRLVKSWNWSKASRFRKIAPSRKNSSRRE